MTSTYKRLGDYIREVDVRNRDLSVTTLLGVSISKEFIPSIANTIGTDMSTYKIVRKGQFAYGPVTSRNGDKVSIALLANEDTAIISQAYTVFEVKDCNDLLPEYLMMWFSRPEFDRYARFHSHGSAREVFDWSEMCDVMLPIPSIERQREIVAEYETLNKRIRLNGQIISALEGTAQTLYRKMFIDGIDKENLPDGWRMGRIIDFGEVVTGKTPSSDNPEDFGNELPFITPGDFTKSGKYIIKTDRQLSRIGAHRLKNKTLPKNSIIVTCIGSDMGKVAITSEDSITNQQINAIVVAQKVFSEYLFHSLNTMANELKSMALGSSTMPLLNKSEFEKISIPIPPSDKLLKFSQFTDIANKTTIIKLKENTKLAELQSLLLAKMGQ